MGSARRDDPQALATRPTQLPRRGHDFSRSSSISVPLLLSFLREKTGLALHCRGVGADAKLPVPGVPVVSLGLGCRGKPWIRLLFFLLQTRFAPGLPAPRGKLRFRKRSARTLRYARWHAGKEEMRMCAWSMIRFRWEMRLIRDCGCMYLYRRLISWND